MGLAERLKDKQKIVLLGIRHGNYLYRNLVVDLNRSHLSENWYETRGSFYEDSTQQPSFRLSLRRFVDFLRELRKQGLTDAFDEITSRRYPYRGEWVDDRYIKKDGMLFVNYNIVMREGTLVEVVRPLEVDECLMENRQIDLDYWLEHATVHGLPPKDTPKGSLHYFYPREDSVARFVADSDGAGLGCDRNPQFSYAGLGVRLAKIFHEE